MGFNMGYNWLIMAREWEGAKKEEVWGFVDLSIGSG